MPNQNKPEDSTAPKKTFWHRLLARLLELILSPLGIEVHPDVSVMTAPPEADILLLRRKTGRWTKAQRAHLPDGIRDSQASHILIEFKYTESFNEAALEQAMGYDIFFKRSKKLAANRVQTVLLSAKKPEAKTLSSLGYQATEYPGVYRAQCPIIKNVLLLSLNELSNEPHNLWIKCFASRKKVKKEAFQKLDKLGFVSIANELQWFIKGLMQLSFETLKGEKDMALEITPEAVTKLGKEFGSLWLANLTVDEVLDRFEAKELASHLKPAERLAGLKPEEVLPHFKPVDRLAGLDPKFIEDYLKQLKRQQH
ncbi:MAG: hypothetical protein DRR16_24550 [Candidatus Parabeggiatoa sp. nov. 3]|nr:MAG: hypothetical protein DRR00_14590 [Gammaproteobacteria bacterium]RKZ66022.1 MAG: hypothetical protein DRQ99_10940 [Gammaproteobacteria bacterium]RKZ80061.1 MAG: hypothetical protein DRR16_24550 [Gammaproteobacteria bacterium]